mmetsp:Transcript_30801/g.60658  ORF Transcript_30801/g.60658 Transcript_30801/m.60658 type:complete len:90 (+) Transcript_30801:637-906(+)
MGEKKRKMDGAFLLVGKQKEQKRASHGALPAGAVSVSTDLPFLLFLCVESLCLPSGLLKEKEKGTDRKEGRRKEVRSTVQPKCQASCLS